MLKTLSTYPVKLYHIKIPDICKIYVHWEPEAYSEYREFLEYSLHKILQFTLQFKNWRHLSEPCQISIMERFVQNLV